MWWKYTTAQVNIPEFTMDVNPDDPEAPIPYFISDTHFDSYKPIHTGHRPFKLSTKEESVAAMNKAMIDNWNKIIRSQDYVFHVGDFANSKSSKDVKALKNQLNGNIILVNGNHDKYRGREEYYKDLFVTHPELFLQLTHPDGRVTPIYLNHEEQKDWWGKDNGAMHLYGHTHGFMPDDPKNQSLDVSVDAHNFTPINLQRVWQIMESKDPTQVRLPKQHIPINWNHL